jgi:hypothetical protein
MVRAAVHPAGGWNGSARTSKAAPLGAASVAMSSHASPSSWSTPKKIDTSGR